MLFLVIKRGGIPPPWTPWQGNGLWFGKKENERHDQQDEIKK